jgi:hypothetical protein
MKTKKILLRAIGGVVLIIALSSISCSTDLGCLQCYDTSAKLWAHEHCYHSYEVRELIIADHYECYEE